MNCRVIYLDSVPCEAVRKGRVGWGGVVFYCVVRSGEEGWGRVGWGGGWSGEICQATK